jgi:hypothetical protein
VALNTMLAANAISIASIRDRVDSVNDADGSTGHTLLIEHADRMRRALRLLARHFVAGDDATALGEACEALDQTTARIASVGADKSHRKALASGQFTAVDLEDSRASLADALREIGFAELDVSLHLGTDDNGAPAIVWEPLPPETALVHLVEYLYDRVERTIVSDPFVYLEREASRWWLDRWSGRRKAPEEHLAWGIREQDWSLVDHVSLALEAPILRVFLDNLASAEDARHRQLANALLASRTDVFLVAERQGPVTILEGVVDARRYEVHEHNTGLTYRPGDVAFGRLIPSEIRRYLRSPGFVFTGKIPASTIGAIAQFVGAPKDSPPAAARIEMLIARLITGEALPRPLPPAASPSDAHEFLIELRELLQEMGRAKLEPASEVPPELVASTRPRPGTAVEYWAYDVDEVLREWIAALVAQAKKMSTGGIGGGKGSKKKRKKNRGRNR